MDSKIIDPDSLLVNAEECQRLSYDMLFDDSSYSNGFANSKRKEEAAGDEPEDTEALRKKIRRLEEEWQQKLDEAKEEAFANGLEKGRVEGKEEAAHEMQQQVDAIREGISSAEKHIDALMNDLKPHMATMVFTIVEKILGLPIKSESLREQVAAEISDLLGSLEQDMHITIVVAAADGPFLNDALEQVTRPEQIKVTTSESLNTGEYVLDTPDEHIVKSFKKMLHDFREKVGLEEDMELEVGS